MKPRIPSYYAAALVAVLSLVGCTINPVTGKNELSLISPQQEITLGEKNYQPSRQAQGGDYYLDPELQRYVARVGNRLAAVSDKPELPYSFVVLNNSVPNAWALPGGKIAINRGLLNYLEDESQLAAVLAHEIVHAAARHGASQMSRGRLASLGLLAVGAGTQSQEGAKLYGLASELGAAAWMAKYGRDDELESDYYGMLYMSRAGYEPKGAVELQRTFVKLSEGKQSSFLTGLFASHPPSARRVEANLVRAKILPSGQRHIQRYQAAIAQLKKDAPAYKAAQEATAALNKNQGKQAIALLDKAIALQPQEGSFWELRGHGWKMQDNFSNADKAFTTAIAKNPDYFSPYLARGLLRHELGQKSQGLADIRRSYEILPTPEASYYLGDAAMTEQQYAQAAAYFKQAAAAGGDLTQRAQQGLTSAQLQLQPELFLSAKLSLSDQGYLLISTFNSSPADMTNIQLRLSAAGQAKLFKLEQLLPAGRSITINTGVGPIVSATTNYRVNVLSATVTQL